ncbi:MAG: phage tail tube protein [Janthinobacterium lividum]
MTTFARGVAKLLTICPETGGFGVPNTTPGAGTLLRRTTSDLNINISQLESQEILPSQQVRDSRNGARTVQGTIAGQLSCGTYSQLFQGLLRNTFQPVNSTPNLSDVSASFNAATGALDLYGSGGDNFTGFFRLGDIVRLTGAAASADNGANFRIVALSPSTMSLSPLTAQPQGFSSGAPGEVFSLPGKKLFIPATGQLDQSFSFEHFYSDIGLSELFVGCKPTQISLNFPASGFVTMQAGLTGQQMLSTVTGQPQLPSPGPVNSNTSLTAVSGRVHYNGNTIAYITAMNLQIMSSVQPVNVVGNPLVPAIFLGNAMAKGTISMLTALDTLTSDFLNEAEVSLSVACTSSPLPGADFISFHLPRVKLTSSTKQDSQTSISRSFGFMALENAGVINGVSVNTSDLTTVMIQDSLTA